MFLRICFTMADSLKNTYCRVEEMQLNELLLTMCEYLDSILCTMRKRKKKSAYGARGVSVGQSLPQHTGRPVFQTQFCTYQTSHGDIFLESQHLEVETERSEIADHLCLHSKFKASMNYVRPCLPTSKNVQPNANCSLLRTIFTKVTRLYK